MKKPVLLLVLLGAGSLLVLETMVQPRAPMLQRRLPSAVAQETQPAATAQPQPQPQPPAASPPAAAGATVPVVDETALRYFARSGDTRRLDAEISRLRALYPNWTPPENPLAIADPGDPELDRLWAIYADGRYAEVRAAIADRQAREPDWQVPPDLLDRLNVAESRQRLLNASQLDQFETVVRIATETPSLLTCAEVDILWRVANAFSQTDRADRALDAYRYILTSCDNPQERVTTIQMASERLDTPALGQLLALERTGADGVGEFEPVRLDLARTAVAAGGVEDGPKASADDVARLARSAEETGSASDLLLLGWYNLINASPSDAADFFRRSAEADASPVASRGLALALLAQGRPADAEAAIRNDAETSDDARRVYAAAAANILGQSPPPDLAPGQLTLIVSVAAALQEANLAQQLGWYSYGLNQFATAGQWFSTSLLWKADEEPAAFGLALVQERLGDASGLAASKQRWGAVSPRIAAVGQAQRGSPVPATAFAPPPARSAVEAAAVATLAPVAPVALAPAPAPVAMEPAPVRTAAPRAAAPAAANDNASCRASLDPRTLSPEAALQRGWCLLRIDRPLEAAPAFEVALLSSSEAVRRDAAYGQSTSYLSAGQADRAAISATRAPQTRDRQLELQIGLLTAEAVAAFESKRPVEAILALDARARLAPERLDLMILRGYAYIDLRRFRDAERTFSAAARAGHPDAARGLHLIRQQRGDVPSD